MTTITARDITREMRTLFPTPVRLSTTNAQGEGFWLRMPNACASQTGASVLQDYLSRHLGQPVRVSQHRQIHRFDSGTDVEFAVALLPVRTAVVFGGLSATPEQVAKYLYSNYAVTESTESDVTISGTDVAGFTLESIIDRLASGLIFARETTDEPKN